MAHALKFHAIVSGRTLTLPDLSAFEGKRVEVIVVEDEAPSELDVAPRSRPLGILRGQLIVPDDFNDPLPAEVQKYFEGEEDKP